MGLILKHDEPFFFVSIYRNGDNNAAGIDFLRGIQIRQMAFFFHLLGRKASHVHQRDRPLCILAIDKFSILQVAFQSLLDRFRIDALLNIDFLKIGFKSGVAAMIGPVCVKNLDFSNGRIPAFFLEIFLDKSKVCFTHGQFLFRKELMEFFLGKLREALDDGNWFRSFPAHFQAVRFLCGGFLGFYRVDGVLFDFFNVSIGQIAFQKDDLCSGNCGPFTLTNELYTLSGKVFPLVILARQEFNGKALHAFWDFQRLIMNRIYRRFRQDNPFSSFIVLIGQSCNIVAIDDTQPRQLGHAQGSHKICQESCCFNSILLLFFHINPSHRFAHDSLP